MFPKKDAKDKKNYTLSSAKKGKKSFRKYFKINKSTGKVTMKKGLKKGPEGKKIEGSCGELGPFRSHVMRSKAID